MFFSFEECLEGVEALVPVFFVVSQPLLSRLKGFGFEADNLKTPPSLARDQIRRFENLEMLRDGGQRDRVRTGNFRHRLLACGDVVENGSPGGIGERVKDRI